MGTVFQSALDRYRKKIYPFLATVPTTMVHVTWKNLDRCWTPTEKKKILATILLWCMGL